MSQYSIVSLYPAVIKERKRSIYPSEFLLPAAPRGGVSVTLLDDLYTRKIYQMDGKSLTVDVKLKEVAEAVCNDFLNSLILVSVGCKPGLFCMEGTYKADEVMDKFSAEVKKQAGYQRAWFERLVNRADDDWKQSGLHKNITGLQRMACDQLGLNKEWNIDLSTQVTVRCPFCTLIIPQSAVVCHHCRQVVDPVRHAAMTKQVTLAGAKA